MTQDASLLESGPSKLRVITACRWSVKRRYWPIIDAAAGDVSAAQRRGHLHAHWQSPQAIKYSCSGTKKQIQAIGMRTWPRHLVYTW